MAQEIEIEYKNLLTMNEFNRLLISLPFPEQGKTQINHYFETADFSLKKHDYALRIREKNNKYTLTLKEPHTTGLLETHDALTKNEVEQWLNGDFVETENVTDRLKDKGISLEKLKLYGSLKTDRRELEYEGVLLVLDYSTYCGAEDYELELEASSEDIGMRKIKDILEQFGIPERPTPNKIQRFFDTLSREDTDMGK
ncbi:CYTH domain-containing protein [Virgibacillus kekensis]|uniref:CYTH domain-containing protein n=1 Tax=Virgibacillus kekensis TaxID=202261 RepID=A0ABV9DKH5_9BACI